MAVPGTVRAALADQAVEGRWCLEAGSGVGNMTAGLLDGGPAAIYAITDNREHARTVRDRCGDGRLAVLEADLRSMPLRQESVDFVTAHGLFNVVPTPDAERIVSELTRVAASGAHLVVDDYSPLGESPIRELFAVENALLELARREPALTFYPAGHLRSLFEGHGWSFDRRKTLLDPVPWTESHVQAHLDIAREVAAELPSATADPLLGRAERLAAEIGSADAGEMYSLAFVR
mgnify:CR=1 FL=1